MKRKSFIHTKFVKFLVEKYKNEIKEEPEDEEDEDSIVDDDESTIEEETEEETTDKNLGDEFDELVKEYNELDKKYRKRKDDTIYNKRK